MKKIYFSTQIYKNSKVFIDSYKEITDASLTLADFSKIC